MSKFKMRSSLSDLYDYITPDGIICEAEIFEVATIEKDADPLSEKVLPYYIELTGKYQGVYFYEYLAVQHGFNSSKRECQRLRKWYNENSGPEGSPTPDKIWEQIQVACNAAPSRHNSGTSVKIRVKVEEFEGELIITEYLPFREEEDSKVDLGELARGIQSGDINVPELTLPEEMKLNPAYLSRIASKYDIDTLATEDSKQLKN